VRGGLAGARELASAALELAAAADVLAEERLKAR
jgi:hypothetical protein